MYSMNKKNIVLLYSYSMPKQFSHITIENIPLVLSHFTSTPSNRKNSTPLLRPYAQTVFKYVPRCANQHNSRIMHFCVFKIDLWNKISNFKHLQKINESTEWSKISIRAVFWHYECNKRFVFAKFKSCIFEKWSKCGRNLSFFSTVVCSYMVPNSMSTQASNDVIFGNLSSVL